MNRRLLLRKGGWTLCTPFELRMFRSMRSCWPQLCQTVRLWNEMARIAPRRSCIRQYVFLKHIRLRTDLHRSLIRHSNRLSAFNIVGFISFNVARPETSCEPRKQSRPDTVMVVDRSALRILFQCHEIGYGALKVLANSAFKLHDSTNQLECDIDLNNLLPNVLM